jgi:hypothetical protein
MEGVRLLSYGHPARRSTPDGELIQLLLGCFLFAEVLVSRMRSEGYQGSQKVEYCDGCDIVRGTESIKMGKPRNELREQRDSNPRSPT